MKFIAKNILSTLIILGVFGFLKSYDIEINNWVSLLIGCSSGFCLYILTWDNK